MAQKSKIQEGRSQISPLPKFLAQLATGVTYRAEWMAQEKDQEEAPHAPASGKGDELERQRMLLDSGGSESSASALSTDPAAIPGSSHLPRLKEDSLGTGLRGKWGTDGPGGDKRSNCTNRFGGSRALVLPTPRFASAGVWGISKWKTEENHRGD